MRGWRIWTFLFALIAPLVAVSLVQAGPAQPPWRQAIPWSTETALVTIGDQEIEAEIADTDALRTRGLSYRESLEPGHGMLFVFPNAQVRTFWMYEMRFCLDIVWIEHGEVVGAAERACPEPGKAPAELARYSSGTPVTHVLELPGGWLDEHRVGAGTPVDIQLPAGSSS